MQNNNKGSRHRPGAPSISAPGTSRVATANTENHDRSQSSQGRLQTSCSRTSIKTNHSFESERRRSFRIQDGAEILSLASPRSVYSRNSTGSFNSIASQSAHSSRAHVSAVIP